MQKFCLTATLAASLIALTGCSQDADTSNVDAPAAETEVAETGSVLNANTISLDNMLAAGAPAEVAEAVIAAQPFASVVDYNAILLQSMSEEQAASLRANVFVPVDLNNATREELALIPGIDDRMIHEFEEYVPYADMAEFDREIGKYVDADEVARYRNYVTIGTAAEPTDAAAEEEPVS